MPSFGTKPCGGLTPIGTAGHAPCGRQTRLGGGNKLKSWKLSRAFPQARCPQTLLAEIAARGRAATGSEHRVTPDAKRQGASRRRRRAASRVGRSRTNQLRTVGVFRRFRASSRIPRSLSPQILERGAARPICGKTLQFRREAGWHILYSVGANGRDEGGRGRLSQPPGDDLALWIPDTRPTPAPAYLERDLACRRPPLRVRGHRRPRHDPQSTDRKAAPGTLAGNLPGRLCRDRARLSDLWRRDSRPSAPRIRVAWSGDRRDHRRQYALRDFPSSRRNHFPSRSCSGRFSFCSSRTACCGWQSHATPRSACCECGPHRYRVAVRRRQLQTNRCPGKTESVPAKYTDRLRRNVRSPSVVRRRLLPLG